MAYKACVQIDWKTSGGEFLPLFPMMFPKIKCFKTQEFNDLIDELAHESPTNCFGPLADFLASFDLDLWNMNSGADDYHLLVTKTSEREKFKKKFIQDQLKLADQEGPESEVEFSFELEQLEPTIKSTSKKKTNSMGKTDKKPGAKKIDWFTDFFEYDKYVSVSPFDFFDSCHDFLEQIDNKTKVYLFDYKEWPPVQKEMTNVFGELKTPSGLRLAYKDADISIWKKVVKTDREKHLDWYKLVTLQGKEVVDFCKQPLEILGFYETMIVLGQVAFKVSTEHDLVKHTANHRLYRISKNEATIIMKSSQSLTLVKLDEQKLLILSSESLDYKVWDDTSKQFTFQGKLPFEPYSTEAVASLGGDEILFFHRFEKINVESGSYQIKDSFMKACKFNYKTGRNVTAPLEKFGSIQKTDIRGLKSQPAHFITYQSFEGNLMISPGHGDWWVWNLLTNSYGTKTVVWFWNQKTDEILKIDSKRLPKFEPTILWAPKLNCYLSFLGTECAKILPFEKVVEAFGLEKLAWS